MILDKINKEIVIALIVAAGLFWGLIFYLNNSTMSPESLDAMMERQADYEKRESEKPKKTNSSTKLITDCQIRLKSTLRNPSSLELKFSSNQATNTSDGTRVSFPYSAENGFGGMAAGHAVCVYDTNGNVISTQFN